MKKLSFYHVLWLLFATPFFSHATLLSGTYVVGQGGDYTTIQEAITDLEQFGVNGAVIIKVSTGLYIEQLTINTIPGASETNKVVIESVGNHPDSVVVGYPAGSASDNYVLSLNNTQHVAIKNITFRATGLDYRRVVWCQNDVSNLYFYGNYFETAVDQSNYGDSTMLVKFEDYGSRRENLIFEKNKFEGGSRALRIQGVNLALGDKNVVVLGNSFFDQGAAGLELASIKGIVVESNLFSNVQGIDVAVASDSSVVITKNNFQDPNSTGQVNIQISFHNSVNHLGKVRITNNIINLKTGSGIRVDNSAYVEIYHNTIYSENTGNYYTLHLEQCDTTQIRNNIVVNNANFSVMYWDVTLNGSSYSDNNVWYCEGSPLFYHGSVPINDLSGWYASLGFDESSVSEYPGFEDNVSFKLGCSTSSTIQVGASGTGITTDIYGQSRDPESPWPGAWERIVPDDNLVTVSGWVTDGLLDTIKAGTVTAFVDSSANEMLDMVGQVAIQSDGSFLFESVPALPMYLLISPDNALYPDYLDSYQGSKLRWDQASAFDPDNCSGMIVDIYPRKIEAVSFDGDGRISGKVFKGDFSILRASNDPIPGLDVVLDKIPPSKTVAITQTDSEGFFSFGNLPEGEYIVTIEFEGLETDTLYDISITATDTVFEFQNYCVDTLDQIYGCNPEILGTFISEQFSRLYPNPVTSNLTIELLNNGNAEVEMYDALGNLIYIGSFENSLMLDISTENLEPGLYFVQIRQNSEVSSFKVVKK